MAPVPPKPTDDARIGRGTARRIALAPSPSGFPPWPVLCSILIHWAPHKGSSGPRSEVPCMEYQSANAEWRNRKKTCNGMVRDGGAQGLWERLV
jgi:hypothetical protein